MSRPDRSRRLVRLVIVAFLLGAVASPTAGAQTSGEEPDVSQFGGYIVSSRSNGFQVTYDSPGLLPTGSPIFQLSVPEAVATLNSGPVGYALASFVFPGPLVADLGSALAASGQETGIPPYPVRAEAFFPSGPTDARQGEQGTEMVATTAFGDSRARSSFSGLDFAPAAFVGSARSASQSVIEGDQVVSRTRTAISDVVLFGGIINIDSVITDIVATSNGTESASAGGTEVSGVTVLGLPATIDEDGVRFDEPPPEEPSDNPVGGPIDGALGGALDPVSDGLGGAAGPLNQLFAELGIAGEDALQQLFEQSGIDVRLLGPIETNDGGTVERTANGLSITINYDGSNTPVLTDLLSLVPSSALPPENLGPIPFSPQALFNLLKETHITGVALAPANVSAAVSPAFSADTPAFVADVPIDDVGSGIGSGSPDLGTGGGTDFETATPDLPPASPATPGSSEPASAVSDLLGKAVPALAALAVLLGAPFFAAGSSRLADNTLAMATTSCPTGLDGPVTMEDQR
jgi:hypothetical protein